jgi:hypothetical protein
MRYACWHRSLGSCSTMGRDHVPPQPHGYKQLAGARKLRTTSPSRPPPNRQRRRSRPSWAHRYSTARRSGDAASRDQVGPCRRLDKRVQFRSFQGPRNQLGESCCPPVPGAQSGKVQAARGMSPGLLLQGSVQRAKMGGALAARGLLVWHTDNRAERKYALHNRSCSTSSFSL